MNDKIQVVVVDDHPIVLRGTCEMIEEATDIQVVASGSDGEEALTLVATYRPHVLLLDIHMPRRDGISVIKELRARHYDLPIVMLTAADDEGQVLDALRSGANGYLLKTATEEELHRAIRMAVAGQMAVVQPEVATMMASTIQRPRPQALVETLSDREFDVLKNLAKDLSNKEIASRLGISDRTVQHHMANIFDKLSVSSRTGAVLRSLHLGLLKLEDTQV